MMLRSRLARALHTSGLAGLLAVGAACAHPQDKIEIDSQRGHIAHLERSLSESQLALRVEADRAARLEREVETLRQDLRLAGQSLIGIESGLKGSHSRADAVAALAEARILVERASGRNPWRADALRSARERLEEADRHVAAGNFGSAVFFASRAHRISERLIEEEAQLSATAGILQVDVARLNLRGGPSTSHAVIATLSERTPLHPEGRVDQWQRVRTLDGRVGWVHRSMVSER